MVLKTNPVLGRRHPVLFLLTNFHQIEEFAEGFVGATRVYSQAHTKTAPAGCVDATYKLQRPGVPNDLLLLRLTTQ